jgi:hypothetical protein
VSRILTIISATMLAGCASGYDKSANSSCKAPPDQQAQWEMVAPGIMSLGMDLQTKKRLGVDNSNRKAASTVACYNEDNKGNEPQTLDLQKIGATLSRDVV